MAKSQPKPAAPAETTNTSLAAARGAKAAAESALRGLVDLRGLGIDKDEQGYLLKANVAAPPARPSAVPATVAGVRLCLEVVGDIVKR